MFSCKFLISFRKDKTIEANVLAEVLLLILFKILFLHEPPIPAPVPILISTLFLDIDKILFSLSIPPPEPIGINSDFLPILFINLLLFSSSAKLLNVFVI